MKNRLLTASCYCAVLLLPVNTWAPVAGAPLTNEKEKVLALARNYVFHLRNYINAQAADADYVYMEINALLEGNVYYLYNDLPGDQQYDKLEFHRYFSLIDEKYRNRMVMEETEADEVVIEDCVEQVAGDTYYTVSFPKRLAYEGKTYEITNIVKIKMVGAVPRISLIGQPENVALSKDCPDAEKAGGKNQEQQARIDNYVRKGNQAFDKGAYLEAKENYEYALALDPSNAALRERIAACGQRLDARQYEQQANAYFAEYEFAIAREYYEKARRYDPGNDFLRRRIAQCDENIDGLRQNIAAGDRYFDAGNHGQALAAYEQALKHSPNNLYCKNRVRECRQAIEYPQLVARELEQARDLRDRNKHVDALLLFNKHKASGKLKADDFYYLGQALYVNAKGIQRKLGYRNKEALGLAAGYISRAAHMGNSNAKFFMETNFSNSLQKLIERR